MRLSKIIKPLFRNWLMNRSKYSKINKLFILIFIRWIPFSMIYGVLTDFLDDHDIHVFSQPGIFLGDKGGRCYYNGIIGKPQNMQAWELRRLTRAVGLKEAFELLESLIIDTSKEPL